MADFKDFFEQQDAAKKQKKQRPFGGKMGRGAKIACIIVAVLVVCVLLSNDMFYQIGEQEQAVIVTLGKPKAVTETGLHFKAPLIQSVHKVNTTIQGFPIGYDLATNQSIDSESVMITWNTALWTRCCTPTRRTSRRSS